MKCLYLSKTNTEEGVYNKTSDDFIVIDKYKKVDVSDNRVYYIQKDKTFSFKIIRVFNSHYLSFKKALLISSLLLLYLLNLIIAKETSEIVVTNLNIKTIFLLNSQQINNTNINDNEENNKGREIMTNDNNINLEVVKNHRFKKEFKYIKSEKNNLLRALLDNNTNSNDTVPVKSNDACNLIYDCFNCSLYTALGLKCKWEEGECSTDTETR